MKRPANPIVSDVTLELARNVDIPTATPWDPQNPRTIIASPAASSFEDPAEPIDLRPPLGELIPPPIDYATPAPKDGPLLRLMPDPLQPRPSSHQLLFLLLPFPPPPPSPLSFSSS